MTKSESNENLIEDCAPSRSNNKQVMVHDRSQSLAPIPEKPLTKQEKIFLLLVERGDCASVRKHIEEHQGDKEKFDIDCMDPLNRSALIVSIENENIELIDILLENEVQVKDALLHAISEEYVEAVEVLLEYEEKIHKPGTPYSWEAVDRAQSTFTVDITPLVMASHKNNYEIIKILLDRGATLPTPHDVRCGCDDCVVSSERDSLRHSQSRINAYRALSSPSLISLSSRDPLLTAFELSWELRRLSQMENEFREEYNEMREQVQQFATSLLDHARSSAELETILNYDPDGENWNSGEKNTLERLKLAIKYKQKRFVAHANVQQLLARMWYDGLPGFRRKNIVAQIAAVGQMASSFPINSAVCLLAPKSEKAKLMNKPFVKFINHSASYAFFLTLLGAASQRVEFLIMEWFGNQWMQEVLEDWKRRERGSLPGLVESAVIVYILSLICWELRSLWSEGFMEYINDMWNIVDYVSNMFYVTWIGLRFTSIFITWREYWQGWDPYYPREQWHPFDPMLLSEGMFAAGMIFSFLKLVHIFSVNRHLGPLQISLGRMIIDIIKFFFIYTLVLFAFGCGMNQLMWYYADLEQKKCYHLPSGLPDFDNEELACTIWRRFSNMFETSQSLFWASFGLVELTAFELKGIKSFTRFWALLMFGSYSVINIIVLLNMLIAMMSNSYQIISEHSDVEWKFARSKLWISYFDEGDVVPPPFNLVPGVNLVLDLCSKKPSGSFRAKSKEKMLERHNIVAKLLVRRFVTAEQSKRDDFGITEDDVMEIRQDISTLRYEIVDILRTNGMKTPQIDKGDNTIAGKKGKTLERRLLQDFKIGCVDGVIAEEISADKGSGDIFSKIARAIGKRKSTVKETPGTSTKKKDWNAIAQRRYSKRDPIGSVVERDRRHSSQRSLHGYIEEKDAKNPEKLLEYNPNLRDMTPTARIAYAKFKTRKLRREKEFHDKLCEEPEEDDVFEQKDEQKTEKSQANGSCNITIQEPAAKQVPSETSLIVTNASPVAPPRNSTLNKNPQDSSKLSDQVEQKPQPPAVTPRRTSTAQRRSPSPRPATPPPSDLSPRNSMGDARRGSRSPSPAPSSSPAGRVLPHSIPEKPSNNAPQIPKPKPKDEPATIQYSSELEPGKGKSKLSGQMLRGWI